MPTKHLQYMFLGTGQQAAFVLSCLFKNMINDISGFHVICISYCFLTFMSNTMKPKISLCYLRFIIMECLSTCGLSCMFLLESRQSLLKFSTLLTIEVKIIVNGFIMFPRETSSVKAAEIYVKRLNMQFTRSYYSHQRRGIWMIYFPQRLNLKMLCLGTM